MFTLKGVLRELSAIEARVAFIMDEAPDEQSHQAMNALLLAVNTAQVAVHDATGEPPVEVGEPVAAWLLHVKAKPGGFTDSRAAYINFTRFWKDAYGPWLEPIKGREFGNELARRGYERVKSGSGRGFKMTMEGGGK